MNSDAADIVNLTRQRMGGQNARVGSKSAASAEIDQDADFLAKLKAAWRIFFPEKPKSLSPKEEGKKRLRMILVADR